MPKQPLRAKLGEVVYRDRLRQQHFANKTIFPQEYTEAEMRSILEEKQQRCRQDFKHLQTMGLRFTPFLEIGAGYGQASLVLTNEFSASGFVSDIAAKPLKAILAIGKNKKPEKMPSLIIFDAEAIPFSDNTFPFVFCYQTLHHFPDPLSVTTEVVRVLAPGGIFFFAEEPVAQAFNLGLWYRPTKLRWWERILKLSLILPFISKIGKTEVDHGIVEEAFSLSTWKQVLKPFEILETELKPFPIGPKTSLEKQSLMGKVFLFFLGGGIKGVVRKKGRQSRQEEPFYACPACQNHPRLKQTDGEFRCPTCKDRYPLIDNIPVLIPRITRNELYG